MPNNSFCTSAGTLSHSGNRSSTKLAVWLGNRGQLGGAIRRRHGHQRPQIPAQFGHAQAQLALVGLERFVFAHLGQNLGLALRRYVGQRQVRSAGFIASSSRKKLIG